MSPLDLYQLISLLNTSTSRLATLITRPRLLYPKSITMSLGKKVWTEEAKLDIRLDGWPSMSETDSRA